MVVGIRAPNGIEGPIWLSFQLLAYLHSVSRIREPVMDRTCVHELQG